MIPGHVLTVIKQSNMQLSSNSPVIVSEGIEQIADGDGHQGEHEHPRPRRRAHCKPNTV